MSAIPAMRLLAVAGGLAALLACGGKDDDDGATDGDTAVEDQGITPDEFEEQFEDLYCAVYQACLSAGCDWTSRIGDPECHFDATAAERCLGGEFTCLTSDCGPDWVRIDPYCASVFECL